MSFHGSVGLIGGTELFIAFSILGLVVGIWVYRDANRRAVTHPALWAAAVGFLFLFYFVVGIAAFAVYLSLRDQLGKERSPPVSEGDGAPNIAE